MLWVLLFPQRNALYFQHKAVLLILQASFIHVYLYTFAHVNVPWNAICSSLVTSIQVAPQVLFLLWSILWMCPSSSWNFYSSYGQYHILVLLYHIILLYNIFVSLWYITIGSLFVWHIWIYSLKNCFWAPTVCQALGEKSWVRHGACPQVPYSSRKPHTLDAYCVFHVDQPRAKHKVNT